jgi:hypothetical protein
LTIRRATAEDAERIKAFCDKHHRRLPCDEGISIIAENNGEMVGYCHIGHRVFVDPLVLNEDQSETMRMRALDELLKTVNGYCLGLNIPQVYFTGGEGYERFFNIIERQGYNMELFTKEPTFRGRM